IRAVAGDLVAVDWADAWEATPGTPGSVLLAGRLADGTRVTIGWHFLADYPAYREDVRFHHVGGSVELRFPAPYRLHEPTRLRVSTGRNEVRREVAFDSMEADPRLAFTLDGQVATIDDYLEVRPEARPRIERLIAEGRLAIGPWQILMDEFLVSGETMIRNLEIGWRAATAYGAAMPVGYLPDMFGHIAQMPQILRRAGIRHAVVWRGVPAAVDRHAFTWRSPDGSAVRAQYLVGGYGNAA